MLRFRFGQFGARVRSVSGRFPEKKNGFLQNFSSLRKTPAVFAATIRVLFPPEYGTDAAWRRADAEPVIATPVPADTGLEQPLPEYPLPNGQWQYDPNTGTIS